jgi:hypothetical protein
LYEEFALSNGQTLHIATRPVRLGDDRALPRTGLTPDIAVATTPEADRRYLNDPYWEPAATTAARPPAAPRRRVTEADLVRQRREGIPLLEIVTNRVDAAAEANPVVKDPMLVRALDMLKALSVVQSWKK